MRAVYADSLTQNPLVQRHCQDHYRADLINISTPGGRGSDGGPNPRPAPHRDSDYEVRPSATLCSQHSWTPQILGLDVRLAWLLKDIVAKLIVDSHPRSYAGRKPLQEEYIGG